MKVLTVEKKRILIQMLIFFPARLRDRHFSRPPFKVTVIKFTGTEQKYLAWSKPRPSSTEYSGTCDVVPCSECVITYYQSSLSLFYFTFMKILLHLLHFFCVEIVIGQSSLANLGHALSSQNANELLLLVHSFFVRHFPFRQDSI